MKMHEKVWHNNLGTEWPLEGSNTVIGPRATKSGVSEVGSASEHHLLPFTSQNVEMYYMHCGGTQCGDAVGHD